MAKVAILGYGTVGSGVYDVLTANRDVIQQKSGEAVEVKYVLDLREFPGDPVEQVLVHDFAVILADPEVSVVAEAMGGLEPAYTFAKKTLMAGKSYCTSNKELVERYGAQLIRLAEEQGTNFFFEASVGGGIPIIRPLISCLTADSIQSITGILNGTTNYILTKMATAGEDFSTVLAEAQRLGYAERNPSADVDGFDACRKVAILASLAFQRDVNYEDIYTEGITRITDVDFIYARELGMQIKLLGNVRNDGTGMYAWVAPTLLPPTHTLSAVNGVFNGIDVVGNKVGELMFFGSGAGKLPTASAVAADVVDAIKHSNTHVKIQWDTAPAELKDFSTSRRRFFVRVAGTAARQADRAAAAFGEIQIIAPQSLQQEFGFITEVMSEAEFAERAKAYGEIISRIRMAS